MGRQASGVQGGCPEIGMHSSQALWQPSHRQLLCCTCWDMLGVPTAVKLALMHTFVLTTSGLAAVKEKAWPCTRRSPSGVT